MSNTTDTKHAELMQVGKSAYDAIDEMITNLNEARKVDDDEAHPFVTAILEDALSVEVRSGWYSPGDGDTGTPTEFRILLSTGGPASRIVGELNQYGEPISAKLEVQDWFMPWTEYNGDEVSESVLLDYCRCFYFGEG